MVQTRNISLLRMLTAPVAGIINWPYKFSEGLKNKSVFDEEPELWEISPERHYAGAFSETRYTLAKDHPFYSLNGLKVLGYSTITEVVGLPAYLGGRSIRFLRNFRDNINRTEPR